MAGTITIPLTTLNDGTRHFGPAALADADTLTVLSLDRAVTGGLNSLTAATTLEITVDQSGDGGATWWPMVDGIISGGFVQDWPPPKGTGGGQVTATIGVRFGPGTGRTTRATVTTTGGPVAVQGSLTTS